MGLVNKNLLTTDFRQTLLLVDDRPENLASLDAILDDGQRSLLKAESGEEALQLLLDHDVALVLLDVQMPLMNGYEVARLMRSNRKTRTIPIIFITAIEREEAAAIRGYQSGAIDYITKPVNALVLQSKVTLFLELDLARRKLQQAYVQVEHTKAYYESILNAAGEGVIGLNAKSQIDFMNPAAMSLLGTGLEALGQECRHNDPAAPANDVGAIFQPTGGPHGNALEETLFRRVDGTRFLVSYCCSPLAGRADDMVVVFQDITLRREMEDELRQQSVTDHLTGLSNRNGFKIALQAELERARRASRHVALMFIDLDHFKRINDTLGHDIGDQLLRHLAHRLREQVRAYDTVSRIGGDEFTVVLGDLDVPEYATTVARKILNSLRLPLAINGELRVIVTASIGIAIFPTCGADVDTLMRSADVAMYQAKQDGRNLYAYYLPEMNARDRSQLQLEQALREAVEQELLVLHYQPQINLKTGRLTGLEGLLRWTYGGELIEPSVFVPMLEDTGLIIRAGQWVLEDGCRRRVAWCDLLPPDCVIALNVSPRQFANRQLPDTVRAALQLSGMRADQLELELTESMLMADTAQTRTTLHELKTMGVRIAVDDFGTGYSSLAYLRQFPMDALKIDKQFVQQLDSADGDSAIATSIIQLAHNLGMVDIAEGIESATQAQRLAELGCDIGQGYYFGRPLSPEAIGVAT
jgi:diguanylate cyclase (GGDEF)-like protein